MKFHKEGYRIIVCSFIIFIVINLISICLAGKSPFFYCVLAFSVILLCLILRFFRNPNRIFSGSTENTVVAPADGTIVVIENVMENEYFHSERKQVSIFMSIFNAHVNWIPVNGTVVHTSHQNGRFMAAYLPKSSLENERSTIVIKMSGGEEILVRQIAGAMARRIVTYPEAGNKCQINEQLGFIKFGSRVDLFLPLDYEIKVAMDEAVKGNQTVIAQLKKN
ncbi:MAG: phosphatidylserine decarboxylase family protein [Dysgonamonadaceae bacterium]|jgi:phosphatidylserine decarboxylase|nr:phosphatidylserine decarboxylase family protein [Dysgonamonadaceae bacterium]